MNWYALYVKTGCEEEVKQVLQQTFEQHALLALVPKRKVPEKKNGMVRQVVKLFFPGYVLIKTSMNPETFYKLKKIPKCFSLVNNGPYYSNECGSYFSSISDEEITPLLELLDHEDIIDYSVIRIENSKVLVTSGPLVNKESMIKKVNLHKCRAKILLRFFGKEANIEVGVKSQNIHEAHH